MRKTRSNLDRWLAAALLLAAPCIFTGCEDSDPVAPEGSSIILQASPTSLDEGGGDSQITAVVLDQNSIPLQGTAVFFSTNAGSLQSQGIGQTTDDNGVVRDLLSTTQSATVDAQSGTATAQVTVTVAGQALVGTIAIATSDPTSGMAPYTLTFTATVTDTNGNALPDRSLVVNIVGDSGAFAAPLFPTTDSRGQADFDVENITVDGTEISVSSGSVPSNVITITITG